MSNCAACGLDRAAVDRLLEEARLLREDHQRLMDRTFAGEPLIAMLGALFGWPEFTPFQVITEVRRLQQVDTEIDCVIAHVAAKDQALRDARAIVQDYPVLAAIDAALGFTPRNGGPAQSRSNSGQPDDRRSDSEKVTQDEDPNKAAGGAPAPSAGELRP